MDTEIIPLLLVTANVGSIFEDVKLRESWTKEFLNTISELKPKFIGLHCQEVGGKNWEQSMVHVEYWLRDLLESKELEEFGNVRIFLDEDFTCTEKFTALGNLYFIHNSLKTSLWDFKENTFVEVKGKKLYSGSIEEVNLKEKSKFPQEFFPECKWSRKGFIRTRWQINNNIFDLINIHLFHDASNFIAIQNFPNTYSKIREKALKYILKRFESDEYLKYPFFVFGDFNFRLDTNKFIQKITNNCEPEEVKILKKNGEYEKKLIYKKDEKSENNILELEEKYFQLENHQETFKNVENVKWLLNYDCELDNFRDCLFEFEKKFPPTYPFSEEIFNGNFYMKTRCPAWCDRIVLSKNAKNLIHISEENRGPQFLYKMMGENSPMGDHKPVYLWFNIGMSSDDVDKTEENLSSSRYVCLQQGSTPYAIFKETTV